MKQNIIAVDFDGTLCENKWPEIGMPNEELIEYLKKRQANGEKLILWTSRNEEQTKEAVEWCKKYGLIFDAVNDNLPEIVEAFGGNCRKIFANEYIDDRNRSIGSCREKSSMERWAENEVAIACRREKPDRKKVVINRYFKEAPNGFAEIDEAEYKERKEAAKARMEATDGSK